MNSPGHRANILNANYIEVGFGIANASEYQSSGPQTIVVALYGKPRAVSTQAPVAPTKTAVAQTPAAAPTTATLPSASPEATPDVALPADTPAPPTEDAAPATTLPQGRVTRLQLAAVDVPIWSVFVTTAIAALAGIIFITRHLVYLHRVVVRSEKFIIKNWKFDLVIIGVAVVSSLLTRTAGFIQ
jgi:hypothetical protein